MDEDRFARGDQALWSLYRPRQRQSRHSLGRTGRAAGSFGIGQDYIAAYHRRAGLARSGRGPFRRRGCVVAQRRRAQCRFRVPELRAIPPHDGVRECCVRIASAPAPSAPDRGRNSRTGKAAARTGATRPAWAAFAEPAVRRPAPAHRARSLAIEPRILLLDEPFGALDAKVRKELRRWLRQLHEEIHVTSVFVTHDQEEALELADRVVVLAKGRVQQIGTPAEVYEHPQSAFVHHFIGESLSVPVTIAAGGVHFAGRKLDLDPHGLSDGGASLFIRPYEVTVVPESGSDLLNGIVKRVHGFGPARRLEIALREGEREHFIEVSAPRQEAIGIGQHVGLRPRAYRLFASTADQAQGG